MASKSYEDESPIPAPKNLPGRRDGDPAPPTGLPGNVQATGAYRVCALCGAGENPRSPLRFREAPDDTIVCERCYERHYGEFDPPRPQSIPSPKPAGENQQQSVMTWGELVVIPCPHCVYSEIQDCSTCANYRRVRVPANCIPVWTPPPAPVPNNPPAKENDDG